jgi:hypothetical protein
MGLLIGCSQIALLGILFMPVIPKVKYRNGLWGLPTIVPSSNAIMPGNDKAVDGATRLIHVLSTLLIEKHQIPGGASGRFSQHTPYRQAF